MSYCDILRPPDQVHLITETEPAAGIPGGDGKWMARDVVVQVQLESGALRIMVSATQTLVKRLRLYWRCAVPEGLRFLGDHWERSYGDLEWRGLVPDRAMPWYFLTWDGAVTHGYGVKTGAGALCFWQVDAGGVCLWLDVRSGGRGVKLAGRELAAATIVARRGAAGESPFQAAQAFCRLMCDRPLLSAGPFYGANDWYFRYGKVSQATVLQDAEILADLAPAGEPRPFGTMNAGWGQCFTGPWNKGNRLFPDMPGLAAKIRALGVRPGLWFRPLLTCEALNGVVARRCVMPRRRITGMESMEGFILDPSVPEVLAILAEDVRRFREWGYEMIEFDYSTYDLLGRYGAAMGMLITPDGWTFEDASKTTAEIIRRFYQVLREAVGEGVLMGCNTIGHLAAGYVHQQRVGDDNSGKTWAPNRNGINALAFRMAQHGAFFVADADCVAITRAVPWRLTRQWLDLAAQSGTAFFVSIEPDFLGPEQRAAVKTALAQAARPQPPGEPLDWLDTTCPVRWRLNGKTCTFNWSE